MSNSDTENAIDLINRRRNLPLGWFAGLDSGQLWLEYQKREPDIGWEIYSKPATKINIRYLEANPGLWPEEREVRIDWEGRDIGVFAHIEDIDSESGAISVWVWDIGREAIMFELPGEDVNATGRRLWASRQWLERMRVS